MFKGGIRVQLKIIWQDEVVCVAKNENSTSLANYCLKNHPLMKNATHSPPFHLNDDETGN